MKELIDLTLARAMTTEILAMTFTFFPNVVKDMVYDALKYSEEYKNQWTKRKF